MITTKIKLIFHLAALTWDRPNVEESESLQVDHCMYYFSLINAQVTSVLPFFIFSVNMTFLLKFVLTFNVIKHWIFFNLTV